MENCIFCKIINGELPSKIIYEDEIIKVIMNINPNSNGHLLVLPKEHLENINNISTELVSHMFNVIKEKLYPLLKEKLNCGGLTLIQNNELGQEIKHYHIHLVPRYSNDNIDLNYNEDMINNLDQVYDELTK